MTKMLDLFRLENGGVLWLGSAENLACAKARLEELAAHSPGEYLVVNLETGHRHVIKIGSLKEMTQSGQTEVGN